MPPHQNGKGRLVLLRRETLQQHRIGRLAKGLGRQRPADVLGDTVQLCSGHDSDVRASGLVRLTLIEYRRRRVGINFRSEKSEKFDG